MRAYVVGLVKSAPSLDFPPTMRFWETAQLRSATLKNTRMCLNSAAAVSRSVSAAARYGSKIRSAFPTEKA